MTKHHKIQDTEVQITSNPEFTGKAIGIAKGPNDRFHLYQVTFDPMNLVMGTVTSLYSDMLEEDVKEKYQIEAARLDFDWGGF